MKSINLLNIYCSPRPFSIITRIKAENSMSLVEAISVSATIFHHNKDKKAPMALIRG